MKRELNDLGIRADIDQLSKQLRLHSPKDTYKKCESALMAIYQYAQENNVEEVQFYSGGRLERTATVDIQIQASTRSTREQLRYGQCRFGLPRAEMESR